MSPLEEAAVDGGILSNQHFLTALHLELKSVNKIVGVPFIFKPGARDPVDL